MTTKKLSNIKMSDLKELASYSKSVATEGIILLENKNDLLPLIDKKVAVFGRIQFDYYKSGTGSGGLVNVRNVDSIIDTLRVFPNIKIDEKVYSIYKNWIEEFPFDNGTGAWASEPWSQKEMSISYETVKEASLNNDCAIVIFGRTAGEDRDNHRGPGSYNLSDEEDSLLKTVTKAFAHTVVILNVGNQVDLSFMDKYKIDGLILAWHGGQYGALALSEILVGFTSPSGKLPFTLAKNLEDYPSDKTFGNINQVIYEEDIYVGYRYFETFNSSAVRYPFGYGLTYSKFLITPLSFIVENQKIKVEISVQNIGNFPAKEVLQLYFEAPQGKLGKPLRQLVAFEKTKKLEPNEKVTLQMEIEVDKLSSFDDEGLINNLSYVLEKGKYIFYIGNSVKNTVKIGDFEINENIIVKTVEEINAPNISFKRLKPSENFEKSYFDTPLRVRNYNENIKSDIKEEIKKSNQNYNLVDVYNKKITINQFISSLTIDELIELTRGEGMSSPKVTPGTAAAFGGVTESLLQKGIPIACAADGPSGIRMDSGLYASSLPIGTLIASTFNPYIVTEMYNLVGHEMLSYNIDLLLGPGMNIIRHPLNGRNFEYFSEDPLLTGMMASAVTKGLQKAGVAGTLKHLFGNNQEAGRFSVDSIISQRAQREIYLKAFEIAIKDSKSKAIMTSYNRVNGLWTASNFEINKKLIRDEWKFNGIIVTDWWAKMNDFGQNDGSQSNTKAMIISQNDLYMVTNDAKNNSNNDNSKESFINGDLKLYHLQQVAKNILTYIITTPAFFRYHGLIFKKQVLRYNQWFKTLNNIINKPIIKAVSINNKTYKINPYINLNVIEKHDKIQKIEAKNSKSFINDKSNYSILTIDNEYENNIYHFYLKNINVHSKELINIKDIKINKYIEIGKKAWDPISINMKEPVYKNSSIIVKNDSIEVGSQDGIITFPFSVECEGKYIIDLKISSPLNCLVQLPFSIYRDNDNLTTLTINGTDDKIINARAGLLLEKGNQLISFKFNKPVINVFEFVIQRHG